MINVRIEQNNVNTPTPTDAAGTKNEVAIHMLLDKKLNIFTILRSVCPKDLYIPIKRNN